MSIVNFVNKDEESVFFDASVAREFANSLKYRPVTKFKQMNASIIPWHKVNNYHFVDPVTGELMEFMATALKSYNTIVCVYISVVQSDNTVHIYRLEWYGYSRTTSKQVTLFKREVERKYCPYPSDCFTFKAVWD